MGLPCCGRATDVLAVLAVYTLRHDFAGGTVPAALTTSANSLVAVKNWTLLIGPGIMPAVNALCFATIVYQSRLVPRWIPTLGLIGVRCAVARRAVALTSAGRGPCCVDRDSPQLTEIGHSLVSLACLACPICVLSGPNRLGRAHDFATTARPRCTACPGGR